MQLLEANSSNRDFKRLDCNLTTEPTHADTLYNQLIETLKDTKYLHEKFQSQKQKFLNILSHLNDHP